jgi:flagellar P-ring protein precursor FlgI
MKLKNLMFPGILLLIAVAQLPAQQTTRIKDVAALSGLEDLQLYGYGLVVGLAGSGDKSQTVFTNQTIVNMLKNLGVELPDKYIRVRNVASVMVTGTLTPFKKKGSKLDATVSSLGDATSLEGGTLILTPMQGPDAVLYASAQGPLATGGYDIQNADLVHIKKNHVLVGLIPDGAIVQRQYELNPLNSKELSVNLSSPDFTSALSMANAINKYFNALDTAKKDAGAAATPRVPVAQAKDAATVVLNLPAAQSRMQSMQLIDFISAMENIEFEVSSQARVVINERTGTIVAGGNVKISQVAVNHGGVKVEIVNRPEAIQPQPFTMGQTEIIPNPEAVVEEKDHDMVVLDQTTTVSDLAQALNSLGVTPRDVIAIFQAIKQAGALQGQLQIM